jgi:hypothetical protein
VQDSGIVGTPHGESIAKLLSTKLTKSRGIEVIAPRTPLTLEHRKPQNQAPFLTDLGGESKGKEPRRVHRYIPPQNSKEKGPENTPRNPPKEGSENHHKK